MHVRFIRLWLLLVPLSAILLTSTHAESPTQHHVYLPIIIADTPSDPDLVAINDAAAGLLYPSEIDAPLHPMIAPPSLTPAAVCQAEARNGERIEIGDVARVLSGPATSAPWMSPEEQATAARFAALHTTIEERLTDPISCRIGTIQVRIFILGVATSGRVVGLHTVAVET